MIAGRVSGTLVGATPDRLQPEFRACSRCGLIVRLNAEARRSRTQVRLCRSCKMVDPKFGQ